MVEAGHRSAVQRGVAGADEAELAEAGGAGGAGVDGTPARREVHEERLQRG